VLAPLVGTADDMAELVDTTPVDDREPTPSAVCGYYRVPGEPVSPFRRRCPEGKGKVVGHDFPIKTIWIGEFQASNIFSFQQTASDAPPTATLLENLGAVCDESVIEIAKTLPGLSND
jgi:hypothetical protein